MDVQNLTLFGDAWTGLEVAACADERIWTLRLIYHLDRLEVPEEEREARLRKYITEDHFDCLAKALRWLRQQFFSNKTGVIVIGPDGRERALAQHVWATDQAWPMLETGLVTDRTQTGEEHTACLMVHVPSLLSALGIKNASSETIDQHASVSIVETTEQIEQRAKQWLTARKKEWGTHPPERDGTWHDYKDEEEFASRGQRKL